MLSPCTGFHPFSGHADRCPPGSNAIGLSLERYEATFRWRLIAEARASLPAEEWDQE